MMEGPGAQSHSQQRILYLKHAAFIYNNTTYHTSTTETRLIGYRHRSNPVHF